MKLVSFTRAGATTSRLGALDPAGEKVVDLRAAHAARLVGEGATERRADAVAGALLGDAVALIESGSSGMAAAREALDRALGAGDATPLTEVALRVPLEPPRLRDCIAFETHMRNWLVVENGKEIPPEYFEIPVFYKGNARTVIGPDEDLVRPAYTSFLDYELELGIVLGKDAVDVPAPEAEAQIFGITCFDDFSARDVQSKEIAVGLGPAKAKDFGTALGPCLVTMDEVGDLYDLEMEARVNGEVWSHGNTGDIHWRFDSIIARMSAAEPLVAGEVFGSGTIARGCGLELGKSLADGDVVELEIERIGVLRNRVVAPRV